MDLSIWSFDIRQVSPLCLFSKLMIHYHRAKLFWINSCCIKNCRKTHLRKPCCLPSPFWRMILPNRPLSKEKPFFHSLRWKYSDKKSPEKNYQKQIQTKPTKRLLNTIILQYLEQEPMKWTITTIYFILRHQHYPPLLSIIEKKSYIKSPDNIYSDRPAKRIFDWIFMECFLKLNPLRQIKK